ncbi:MAG: 4-(cytidine 5'-diphospho)-2-C-methyl-D-erythritol kinase [bacterium]|nr:4-(cytidine 5'-diphospho)-2-C-methyl-D-erythritol kinase [bacterium]MDW8164823.1 4-(cytidine 5'-diphospho)-2-C-methyl-D-erythritol kinase [Candidatus Omnitrophota bacterium]
MWKIKAPAKINLFLEVGKKENSLHPIISLVDIISLYDYIYVKKSKKTNIKFISKWEIPEENTVSKLISVLKKNFNFEVEIIIEKKIPPGTGLGGGSSDAGITLLFINKIFNLGLKMNDLIEIAKKIGSDVPLFLYGKRCIIKKFGEEVSICDDFKLYYLLLIPKFSVKTKDVYDKFDEIGEFGNLTYALERVRILIDEIKNGNISRIEEMMFNRLEEACYKIKNEIKEVKDEVERKIGKKFFLSGSGGVLFSIFKEKEEVGEIKKRLKLGNWRKVEVESI